MLENTIAITFADNPIHYGYQKEFEQLYKDRFGQIISYKKDDIVNTFFYKDNMQMFKYKKYFGYFLWKPYIILETIRSNYGKQVLYCDSNLRFTDFTMFENYYRVLMEQQGAFFIRHEHFINKDWTKWDCFLIMDACYERYYNAHQVWTPLMGFDSKFNRIVLLEDYLHYCKNPQAATEEPNLNGPNLPGFREHRWEQSIMSILVERNGYSGIPDTKAVEFVTKYYSPELMKMKEEVNANPLGTN